MCSGPFTKRSMSTTDAARYDHQGPRSKAQTPHNSIYHAFSLHSFPLHQHLALVTPFAVPSGRTIFCAFPFQRVSLIIACFPPCFHISGIQTIRRVLSVAWSIIKKKNTSNAGTSTLKYVQFPIYLFKKHVTIEITILLSF